MDYDRLMMELENCLGLETSAMESVKTTKKEKVAFEGYDEVEKELATELGVEVPAKEATEEEVTFLDGEETAEPAVEPNPEEEPDPKEIFKEQVKTFFNSLDMEPEEAMKVINEVMAEALDCGKCETEEDGDAEEAVGQSDGVTSMENYDENNLSPFYKALVKGTPEEQQKMLLAAYPWMAEEKEDYTITDAFNNEVDELHDYGLEGFHIEGQEGEGDEDFKENLEEYNTFKFADESYYMRNLDDCKALVSVLSKLGEMADGELDIESLDETEVAEEALPVKTKRANWYYVGGKPELTKELLDYGLPVAYNHMNRDLTKDKNFLGSFFINPVHSRFDSDDEWGITGTFYNFPHNPRFDEIVDKLRGLFLQKRFYFSYKELLDKVKSLNLPIELYYNSAQPKRSKVDVFYDSSKDNKNSKLGAEEGCGKKKTSRKESSVEGEDEESAFEEFSAKMLNRYKNLAEKEGFGFGKKTATEGVNKISICESAIDRTSCEFNYSGENLRKMVKDAIEKGVI